MNLSEKISKRILFLMKEKSMTKEVLLSKTNLNSSKLESIINDNGYESTTNELKEIARAFDMVLYEFFNDPSFEEEQ